jgi:hypothetical protein
VDADAPDNRGPWDVYASQSLNVLSTTTTPTWRQFKVSEHPVHDNEICLSGIGCTAGEAEDRDMLDDFTSDIDPKGMLHIAYNDTNNQIGASTDADAGGAFVMHTRQLSGPSLYTKVGSPPSRPSPSSPALPSAGEYSRPTTPTHFPRSTGRRIRRGTPATRAMGRAARARTTQPWTSSVRD